MKHQSIAGTHVQAEGIALLGPSFDYASPVILLILGIETKPPAGIDMPRPPADTSLDRILAVLKLRITIVGIERSRVILIFRVDGDVAGYRHRCLDIHGTEV